MNSTIESTLDTNQTTTIQSNSFLASLIIEILSSNSFSLIICIIWLLLVVLAVLGNGLVIIIALMFRKLNDITNFYIFNLAITDLLFAIFCIPFTTYLYLFDVWTFGVFFCKINHFMSHASVQATCLTLTAMTIHRCKIIINNETVTKKTAKLNKRRRDVLIIVIIIWIASFIMASPDLIYYNVVYFRNESFCSIDHSYSILEFYINISSFVSIATTYVIPLVIIIISYAKLISHLSKNQKRMAKFSVGEGKDNEYSSLNSKARKKSTAKPKMNSNEKKSEDKRRKVTMLVVLVTINFAFCWFSTHLLIIIRRSIEISQESNVFVYLSLFKIVAHTLSYLTPVINPFLYAFFNPNFQSSLKEFWFIVTCRKRMRSNSTPETNVHRSN